MPLLSGAKQNSKNIFYSFSKGKTSSYQPNSSRPPGPIDLSDFLAWKLSMCFSHALSSVTANALEIPGPDTVLLVLTGVIKDTDLSCAVTATW